VAALQESTPDKVAAQKKAYEAALKTGPAIPPGVNGTDLPPSGQHLKMVPGCDGACALVCAQFVGCIRAQVDGRWPLLSPQSPAASSIVVTLSWPECNAHQHSNSRLRRCAKDRDVTSFQPSAV